MKIAKFSDIDQESICSKIIIWYHDCICNTYMYIFSKLDLVYKILQQDKKTFAMLLAKHKLLFSEKLITLVRFCYLLKTRNRARLIFYCRSCMNLIMLIRPVIRKGIFPGYFFSPLTTREIQMSDASIYFT